MIRRPLLTDDPTRRLRHQRLCAQLRPLLSQLSDGMELVDEYLNDQSLDGGLEALGAGDAEGLLAWLATSRRLSPIEGDHVTWQRARLAVERRTRELRDEHLRFQQQLAEAVAEAVTGESSSTPGGTLHLNPVRVWARMESSELIDEQVEPPAQVLMFPVAGEIRHLTLGLEDQAIVNELADFCPCTIDEWVSVSRIGGADALLAALQPLISVGLIGVFSAATLQAAQSMSIK